MVRKSHEKIFSGLDEEHMIPHIFLYMGKEKSEHPNSN